MSLQYQATVITIEESTLIYTGSGLLFGIQIATDGSNDPTITAWDGVAAAGIMILPTTEFEADYKGLNGFTCAYGKSFITGLYIEIAGAGQRYVTIDYRRT
jgi:hypothetical protein